MNFQHPNYQAAESFAQEKEKATKLSIGWIVGQNRHQRKLTRTIFIPCMLQSGIYVYEKNLKDVLKCDEQPSFQDIQKRKKLFGHINLGLKSSMAETLRQLVKKSPSHDQAENVYNLFFKLDDVLTLTTEYSYFADKVAYYDVVNDTKCFRGTEKEAYQKTIDLLEGTPYAVVEAKLIYVILDGGLVIQRSEISNIYVYK